MPPLNAALLATAMRWLLALLVLGALMLVVNRLLARRVHQIGVNQRQSAAITPPNKTISP
jgi:hypothetical protein